MESFEFKFIEEWLVYKNQQIPTEKESTVRHQDNENLSWNFQFNYIGKLKFRV